MWMLERYFDLKLNRARINKHLRAISGGQTEKTTPSPVVSAVQREIRPVKSIEEYIDMINEFVKEAALLGCDLVAFPEYNIIDLAGLIPGFNRLSKRLETSSLEISERDIKNLYDILFSTSVTSRNAIETIMCFLAQSYRIYIYTGSYFIREGDRLYNCGSLISREGQILGTQKKLHLTDLEYSLGISRGSNLEVFETDIGKISCPIGIDGAYFETFKLLRNKGCDVVVLPTANMEEYKFYKALRGPWLRSQESGMYIIKSSLNGKIAGMHFTGRSGIYAPLGVTENKGVVNYSRQYEGSRLITAVLDMKEINNWRETSEYFGDSNTAFEENYFIKTYGTKRL